MSPIPGQAAASISGRSFDITARVSCASDDNGVLFAYGTENSGISFFVLNNRLVIDYNAFDDHSIIESDSTLPNGEVELKAEFRRLGKNGTIELFINEKPSAKPMPNGAIHDINMTFISPPLLSFHIASVQFFLPAGHTSWVPDNYNHE